VTTQSSGMVQLGSTILLHIVEPCPPNTYHTTVATEILHRKRLTTHDLSWHAHELTFSCYHGKPFLLKERVRIWLAEAVTMGLEKHSMDLWAYVIMPEHVHLVVWPRNLEYSISAFLETVKKSVARKAIRYLRTEEPEGLKHVATGQRSCPYCFWQRGGGYDRNIVSRSVLVDSVNYIHDNPVRRKLVESPTDWEWSSARQWVSNEDGRIQIDRISFPVT